VQKKMELPINFSPSFHLLWLKFLLHLKLCKQESGNSHFPLYTTPGSCMSSLLQAAPPVVSGQLITAQTYRAFLSPSGTAFF